MDNQIKSLASGRVCIYVFPRDENVKELRNVVLLLLVQQNLNDKINTNHV